MFFFPFWNIEKSGEFTIGIAPNDSFIIVWSFLLIYAKITMKQQQNKAKKYFHVDSKQ